MEIGENWLSKSEAISNTLFHPSLVTHLSLSVWNATALLFWSIIFRGVVVHVWGEQLYSLWEVNVIGWGG